MQLIRVQVAGKGQLSRIDGYGIKHGTVDSTEMIKIF